MSTEKTNSKSVEFSDQIQNTNGADNRSDKSVSSNQIHAGQADVRSAETVVSADVRQDKWSDNTKKEVSGRVASGSSSGVSSKGSEISDSSSESSGPGQPSLGKELTIVGLCKRGEWLLVERKIRALSLEAKAQQVSERDEETGMTALMFTVHENKLTICNKFIELGADVNDTTY
ncbi:unnamed protein product, partial [Candidula unifasciata]